MANNNTKQLAVSLLKADTEEDVIKILKDAGYWNDPAMWRYYGDREGKAESHPKCNR